MISVTFAVTYYSEFLSKKRSGFKSARQKLGDWLVDRHSFTRNRLITSSDELRGCLSGPAVICCGNF